MTTQQHQQPECDEPWEVWWCYDGWHPAADNLQKRLPPWAVLKRCATTQPLSELVRQAKVLIPTTGIVDANTINAAVDLRLIAQPAAGYNNIDLQAAKARGVPVTIAPGLNCHSVAEVTLMMILMLARRATEALEAFKRRDKIGGPVGMELRGKTLGVIGLGKVGGCVATAAEGLGMKVIGITSQSTRAQLEQLLASSDVIAIHCPLTDRTRGLIGTDELGLMKPHALLINCARGPVIERDALLGALREGRLGGVGLDVHWVEPAPVDDELYSHSKVLSLPHLGSICSEVYERFASILCENIVRIREGRELLNQLC